MLTIRRYFLFLRILIILEVSESQSLSDLKALRTYLFTTNDYDSRFRPVSNQSDVIDVNIALNLVKLNEINDLEETMTTTAYIRVTWTDEELTWKPSSFGNTAALFFPQEYIWTPDIAVQNSNGKIDLIGFDSLNAKIIFNGRVDWVPYQQFVSTCSLNIRKYPFDTQNCNLILTSWSYTIHHMTFSNASTISTNDYRESPSWKLKSTSVSLRTSVNSSPELVFTLALERKSIYTILTVLCPIILLAVLNLFVFVVPAGSGEKSGYAVTVFLSLAVFLTIVDSSIPKNSETVPIFSQYLVTLLVQSTIITVLSLVLIKCITYDDRGKPVPKILVKLTCIFNCKACKKAKNQVERISNDTEQEESSEKDCCVCINCNEELTWAEVVNSLDRFLFILFTVMFVLCTIIFAVLITK